MSPRGLNFDPFPSLPYNHFRRDVCIHTHNMNLFGVATIELPKDFKDGDEVKLCITFQEGYIYRGGFRIANLKGKMQPIRYKGSLYEYIQKVLSDDYIINHILSTMGD